MAEFLRSRALTAFLCTLVVSACAFTPAPLRGGVTINMWRTIDAAPSQPWHGARTRLYTYVLIGDAPSGASEDAQAARAQRALLALLEEVQAGAHLRPGDDPNLMPAQLMSANQYCIPFNGQPSESVNLLNYDRSLASAYLSEFKLVLAANDEMAKRLAGPGPFFLATRKPVGELVTWDAQGTPKIDSSSPVLLMDMSGKHERTIPVYVAAFQDSIRKNLTDSSATLQPLSPEFASVLIKAGEALPFISEAYAGTKKLFQ
jgi:hypothetical protein